MIALINVYLFYFRCDVVLKEHDTAIRLRSKASKENSEPVTSMEANLHQYFTEQNTKLIKVS